AVERLLEDRLAGRDRLLLRHPAEAEFLPRVFGALDDEGRRVVVELVGVRPNPAVLRLLEDEGEGIVELLVRAEPDEFAFADVDLGPEGFGELLARLRVQPVRGDDEIVIARIRSRALRLGLEPELDAEIAGAGLQEKKKHLSADAAETMAGRDGLGAAIVD